MEQVSFDALMDGVKRIYRESGPGGAGEIEVFLEKELGRFSVEDRVATVEALGARLASGETPGPGKAADEEVLSDVCSLLLGREVSRAELSSAELLERLAESLNTIFDSLNELVGVINTTLTSERRGQETIRQVIGGHLEGEDQRESLESYLGQIRKAFLATQKAFKQAAYDQVKAILSELDPQAISSAGSGGLKFGALRKADCFDTYEEKFKKVEQWFDSGRFMEALLREFEKNAQKLAIS